jgi:hypothetical protein
VILGHNYMEPALYHHLLHFWQCGRGDALARFGRETHPARQHDAGHDAPGNKRVLDQLAVFGAFTDSTTALQSYGKLHRVAPQRELYVFHTSRKSLDITERSWLGVRGLQPA